MKTEDRLVTFLFLKTVQIWSKTVGHKGLPYVINVPFKHMSMFILHHCEQGSDSVYRMSQWRVILV